MHDLPEQLQLMSGKIRNVSLEWLNFHVQYFLEVMMMVNIKNMNTKKTTVKRMNVVTKVQLNFETVAQCHQR